MNTTDTNMQSLTPVTFTTSTSTPPVRRERRLSSDIYFDATEKQLSSPHVRSSSYTSLPLETSYSTQVRTSTPLRCALTKQVHSPVSPIAVSSQSSVLTASKVSFKESSVEKEQIQAPKDMSADDSTSSSADVPLLSSIQPRMASFSSDASIFVRNAQRSFQSFLNPTYRQRNAAFRKLFGKKVPEDDEFVTDFSCAYQREILVHGRMYVTRARVCFHANIFMWETVHVLPFSQMSAITKERTAKVIPNAIQINLRDGAKHFFTTFARRDRTYQLLFRLWRIRVEMREPPDLEELLAMVDANNTESNDSDINNAKSSTKKFSLQHKRALEMSAGDQASVKLMDVLPSIAATDNQALLHAVQTAPQLHEEKIDENSNENSNEAQPLQNAVVNSDAVVSKDKHSATPTAPATPQHLHMSNDALHNSHSVPGAMAHLDTTESSGDAHEQTTTSPDTSAQNDLEHVCGCVRHEGHMLLSQSYNFSVEQLFLLLFTDVPFARKFAESQKCTDLDVGEWAPSSDDESIRTRRLRYTKHLNAMVGPRCAYCDERQTIHVDSGDGRVYVVECEIINGGVPYSDSFVVRTRYCIVRRGDRRCQLTVHGGVVFTKNTWAITRTFIEKPSMQGLSEYFEALATALQAQAEALAPLPATVEVHKLRRRSTRLTKDTEPPVEEAAEVVPALVSKKTSSLPRGITVAPEPNYDWLMKPLLIVIIIMVVFNALLLFQVYTTPSTPSTLGTIDCTAIIDALSKVLNNEQSDPSAKERIRTWLQAYTAERTRKAIESLEVLDKQIAQLKAQLAFVQQIPNAHIEL